MAGPLFSVAINNTFDIGVSAPATALIGALLDCIDRIDRKTSDILANPLRIVLFIIL
jgi:hypothetical protein